MLLKVQPEAVSPYTLQFQSQNVAEKISFGKASNYQLFNDTVPRKFITLPAPYLTLYIVGWTKDKLERMEENRMPKLIFSQELEGPRRRGRPRKRWKEEVERDLQVLGVRRWRELATDRKKWEDIVRQAVVLMKEHILWGSFNIVKQHMTCTMKKPRLGQKLDYQEIVRFPEGAKIFSSRKRPDRM